MTNVTAQTPGVSLDGNTLTLDLTRVTALQPEGGSIWVSDADAIVVHPPGDEFRAFSAICAHEGNPVRIFEPWGAGYRLRCPSHGWTYDLEGQPTGEARRGIPRLALTRENDLLRVTLA
jgi:nitrite reductase/ring-hydroxylating ferredoxin subunit